MSKERTKKKERIDNLLVEKGLVESRSLARSVLMSGSVYVDGQRVDKAGKLVNLDSEITIKDEFSKFVSRGGLKLQKAVKELSIEVEGRICMDIGSSTGGFTDCLLQNGAAKVYAVDVGYGQLHWKLRNDHRVILRERLNARYLKKKDINEEIDIATIDVSFISMKKIIPSILPILKKDGIIIGLIKPQFEVGKGEVGKGGIIRDNEKHKAVISDIQRFFISLKFGVINTIESPISGADGNKEFLIYAKLKQ